VRRIAPVTIVSVCVTALLVWYVIYTQGVVRELRREASRVGLMYARVYNGLSDPNPDAANAALLDLSRHPDHPLPVARSVATVSAATPEV